jgi:hypothetical protein
VCAPTAVADDAPVTPAGWRVAPAGQEISVPKIATGFQGPQNSALSPDSRMLLAAPRHQKIIGSVPNDG